MDAFRFLACLVFRGFCFVTIDRGEEYSISGASATPERKEHEVQGPTTTLLHPTGAEGLLLYFTFSVATHGKSKNLTDSCDSLTGKMSYLFKSFKEVKE